MGQAAPDFKVKDTSGKEQSLAAYKGKFVVLEWTNPDCPFVQKHYDTANMPATQKAAEAKGVVWLTVSSTAKDAGRLQATLGTRRVDEGQRRQAHRRADGR